MTGNNAVGGSRIRFAGRSIAPGQMPSGGKDMNRYSAGFPDRGRPAWDGLAGWVIS
jgi:hypothetical protein